MPIEHEISPIASPRAIVSVAGRRIDAPGSASPRFPLSEAPRVERDIVTALEGLGAVGIVASAACGADLLALRAAERLGLVRHIVLPFEVARFRTTSVVDRPGDWSDLFDHMIAEAKAADRLTVLDEQGSDADLYRRCSEILPALADTLAEKAGLSVAALLVWDGRDRGPTDLSAFHLRQAEQRQIPVLDVRTL